MPRLIHPLHAHRWPLVACVLAAFSLAGDVRAPGNLLPNPSFEQVEEATGYPLHWRPVWNTPTTCAYTLARARTGVASVLITDHSDEQSHGLRSARVKIEPNRWYEAQVYVRIRRSEKTSFSVYLEYWNRAGVRVEHKAVATSETGKWRPLRVRLKAPPEAQTATVLVYGSSLTVGEAYFDDASLTLAE